MKSLVQIVNEVNQLENILIEAGGETNDQLDKMLAVSSSELAQKVDGYVEIIERLKSMSKHYDNRSDFFKQISSQCDNAIKRLKNNIEYAMNELKVNEIHGNDMRFKLSETAGSLAILDEDLIPVEFKSEKTETVINKKAIKDALTAGKSIPGAELITGTSLKSFANNQAKRITKKEVV